MFSVRYGRKKLSAAGIAVYAALPANTNGTDAADGSSISIALAALPKALRASGNNTRPPPLVEGQNGKFTSKAWCGGEVGSAN